MNPYTDYYRPSFAFSAFSYPLPHQLASRLTCHRFNAPSPWRRIGLTTFPFLPNPIRSNFTDRVGTIRLVPVYSPAALRRRTPNSNRSNPLRTILVRACQPLWPVSNHEVYRRFTSVAHAEFALPPRHITASSVVTPSPVVTSFDGYVVPGASHPTVASRARPGRQLLVAQQVTAR